MSDLYPTKTRRDLLAAVRLGNVNRQNGIAVRAIRNRVKVRVDAAIREQETAGWVRLGPDGATYELTDAGRAVLDGAR